MLGSESQGADLSCPSRGHLRLLPPGPSVPVRPLSVYQAVAEAEL